MESVILNYSREWNKNQKEFEALNKMLIDEWNIVLEGKNVIYKKSLYSLVCSTSNFVNQVVSNLANFSFDDIIIWHNALLSDNENHFKDGHNFNVFQLLRDNFGFNVQETMHSRLIKFLLDPTETHGQGDLFLMEMLKTFNVESPEKGIWKVTAEVGRIDVLIERNYPQTIIVIENKSNWAKDQKNQLYRYWYQAIYQKTKEHAEKFYESNSYKYQMIYLVPNTNKAVESHSISKPSEYTGVLFQNLPSTMPIQITIVTFNQQIQDWLSNCIAVLPEKNHRIREYIIQYQSLCNNL